MRNQETKTLPRTFEFQGVTATANVRFKKYGSGWYLNQAETAKVVKAIAKAAGFNVLGCKSQSFAGGDSVDLYVESELTDEQHVRNESIRGSVAFGFRPLAHPDWAKEPREDFLDLLASTFMDGSFNGMEDIYEYKHGGPTVEDPDGKRIRITSKYVRAYPVMKEYYEKFHK